MKLFSLITILIIVVSCSTSKNIEKQKSCVNIRNSKFIRVLDEKYKTIYDNDTITYNEVKFECVLSAFYSHKVMFDKFGKWDKAIYPSNKKHPILTWENVDLFSNGKKYNVFTNGDEGNGPIYASIMVFDKDSNDLLTNTSKEKEELINYFFQLIKKEKNRNRKFYKVYWEIVL